MREITAWTVFKAVSNDGTEKTVLVGFDPSIQTGIVEEVTAVGEHEINGYTLIGPSHHHFEEYQEVWMNWVTKNNINNMTDISAQYE